MGFCTRKEKTNKTMTQRTTPWSLVTCCTMIFQTQKRYFYDFVSTNIIPMSSDNDSSMLFRLSSGNRAKCSAMIIINSLVYYLCKTKGRSTWNSMKHAKLSQKILNFLCNIRYEISNEWKHSRSLIIEKRRHLRRTWRLGKRRWWMCRLLIYCEVRLEIRNLTHDYSRVFGVIFSTFYNQRFVINNAPFKTLSSGKNMLTSTRVPVVYE